ncbi:hypothetical protein N7481_003822 [Penicillium waksmanii]|uniref:uncharacterized protein n=1 Tax=Penicillium waksmanii TaxID=69791 RepID=UPI002547BBDF|nr:uncharacterized protein N7481_003822 [Penicillium waksmanii]KAJ5988612.1 hypothetical protein N7481_003822 [Penicillium waksmanii]
MQQKSIPSTSLEGSKVASIISCNAVCISLATAGVCARMIAQTYARRFDVDDVTRYGYGRRFALIEADVTKVTMLLKLDFVLEISYLISLASIKISFCLLYLKVFSITKLRWLYYLVIVIVTCQFIEELFVVIFQCSPVSKFFHPTTVAGSCIDLYVFYFISFATRLATDILLFLLPIPHVLRLQMPFGVKAGLVVMFGLGLLVCVTSIVRVAYIRHFEKDLTWDLVEALNWSSIEVCIAILIACIPSFRNLVVRTCPVLQKTLGLGSSHKPSQETDTLHTSPLDQNYFTLPIAAKPSGPRDCFPLPSPLVEEGITPITDMSGALEPEITEPVVRTSQPAEPYLRTMDCVGLTGLSLALKHPGKREDQL